MRAGFFVSLGIFLIGALLVILQIWGVVDGSEGLAKTYLSLGVLFAIVLVSTLVGKEYIFKTSAETNEDNHEGGACRWGSLICLGSFNLGAIVVLVQTWFDAFDASTFAKLLVTLGIITLVSLIVTLVLREQRSEKKLRDRGFID